MEASCDAFQDVSELLKAGPTVWFAGRSCAAGDGQAAVANGNFRLVFRKEDVIGTMRVGGHDAVCVSVDANMVVESRLVAKASGAAGCACGGGNHGAEATARRDWFGGNYDVGFFEAGGCWLKIECKVIDGRRFCFVVGIICPTLSTGED